MAISDEEKAKLNRMCPVARDVKLGDQVQSAGGFDPAAVQAASTATDVAGLVADFNSLLAKLKTAGIMASS